MTRLPLVTTHTADADQRELLAATEKQLGRVPNLYAAMANGPAVLRGYLAMRQSLTKGELGAVERELLALLIAQDNECEYCVSAHTMRGQRMSLSDDQLLQARRADSTNPHIRAVLRLARAVMADRGRISDAALAEAREASVTTAQVAEVLGHVALNVLSNYFNHLAEPELDFPRVEVALAANAT
jgi:uncharacterized peroxidase-related enzyme